MFRKLVSNLSFSPSLVNQIGFYANRLKKEEVTRRAGLIFTVLALLLQSLAVFQAPESANASNSNDFVQGGVSSKNEWLKSYDKNTKNLKDVMDYLGITRQEVVDSNAGTWKVSDKYSWGFNPKFSYAQGERSVKVTKDGEYITTVYARPMQLWYSSNKTIEGWVGKSEKVGWFAIMKSCGNLVTKIIPPPPPEPKPNAVCQAMTATVLNKKSIRLYAQTKAQNGAKIISYTFNVFDESSKKVFTKTIASSSSESSVETELDEYGTYTASVSLNTSIGAINDPDCYDTFTLAPPEKCPLNEAILLTDTECQPCSGDNSLWIKDERCNAQIIRTKDSFNIDLNQSGTKSTALASQKIRFTIEAENTGLLPAEIDLTDNIADTLEYAVLVDAGGGTLDKKDETLSWGTVSLEPGKKTDRTFVVQVLQSIPSMSQGASEPTSYDCKMTNTFGNSTSIRVDCPPVKVIETVTKELPHTGPRENMIFAGILFGVVTYFYARSRQLKTEIRLIRKTVNTGAI